MKKHSVAILTAAVIILSYFGTAFQVVVAVDSASWYKTVNGVNFSDYYTLYPFQNHSLDIGFSKYGEMIDSVNNVGLQYAGYDEVKSYDQSLGKSRDPFANELVSTALWVNGWLVNITYRNKIYMTGENTQNAYRNVWAFALFSDGQKYGGEWHTNMSAPTLNTGGRQTNKFATTDDMQILYDGPRELVAMLVTHISDAQGDATWPLADVILTVIFDKVQKEVIIFKEVKLKLETKYLDGLVDVELSNRGEWDLGPYTGTDKIRSYADFYPEVYNTSYSEDWHTHKNLVRKMRDTYVGVGTVQTIIDVHNATGGHSWYGFKLSCPTGANPFVDLSEHVFVNGAYMLPTAPPQYIIRNLTQDEWWLLFPQQLVITDKTVIEYKNYIEGTHPIGDATSGHFPVDVSGNHAYSLAQIISADTVASTNLPGNVVGFAAYWPVLSDYTPDGWNLRLQSLLNVQATDMGSEPNIPFLIGEWDFMLNIDEQFRGVTVYGITEYHDAKDEGLDSPYKGSVIDREVQYQLDEVFKPWDLNSAVNKKTTRWVDYSDDPIGYSSWILEHSPVLNVTDSEWDQYCTFSERVEDLTTGKVLKRYYKATPTGTWKRDYNLTVDPDTGEGNITGLNSTHYYKFLYSTDTVYNYTDQITADWAEYNVTWAASIDRTYNASTSFYDYLGVEHSIAINDFDFTFRNVTSLTGNATWIYNGTIYPEVNPFKVFKEDTTVFSLSIGDAELSATNVTAVNGTLEMDFDKLNVTWSITPPDLLDVHFYEFNPTLHYVVTVNYNATGTNNYTITGTLEIGPDGGTLYSDKIPGRYEWVTVGRDSKPVDSAGSPLVSAAFKNKQVEIGNAGTDMNATSYALEIPYLLYNWGTGGTFANYFITADATTPGQRLTLKDDWCNTWPIASSNIIAVGGPSANLITMYFNDFTTAFYGTPWFTPYSPWSGGIVALPCWSKNAYTDSGGREGLGYAMIGTYKDNNGTVGFTIWGLDARDTFYASKFFHEEIIYELQNFPKHATSIIIEIDYTDPMHPTFTIPEVLGTISERLVEDGLIDKGGLHPDP